MHHPKKWLLSNTREISRARLIRVAEREASLRNEGQQIKRGGRLRRVLTDKEAFNDHTVLRFGGEVHESAVSGSMVARLAFTIGEGEPRSLAPSLSAPSCHPHDFSLAPSAFPVAVDALSPSRARARVLHASAFTPRASPPACVSIGVTHARTHARSYARMNDPLPSP